MFSSLILAASLTGGTTYNQGPCCYMHCPVVRQVARAAVKTPVVAAKRVVAAPVKTVQAVRQNAAVRQQVRVRAIHGGCASGQCGRPVWRRR